MKTKLIYAALLAWIATSAGARAAEGEWRISELPTQPEIVTFSVGDQHMQVTASVTGSLCKFRGRLAAPAYVQHFELNVAPNAVFSQINFLVRADAGEFAEPPGGVQFICEPPGALVGVNGTPKAKFPPNVSMTTRSEKETKDE